MLKGKKRFALTLGLAALALLGTRAVFAADPLPVTLSAAQAFRHVLEDNDWLIMGRINLLPLENTNASDDFTVTTTSGDFDDPVVLVNKIYVTGGTDFTVVADDTDDITTFCDAGPDSQTITCEGTALADASHDITVTYRTGWLAYSAQNVFVRLLDSGTPVAERAAPSVGYKMVAIYLTASEVTALGLTWSDAGITFNALADPNLWASPSSAVAPSITWNGTSTHAATVTVLTTQTKLMLAAIEANTDAAGTLIASDGKITNAGAVIATGAFSLIRTAIPLAFQSATFNPIPTPITTPTVSLVVTVQAGVSDTAVNTGIRAIHPLAPIFLTMIGSFVLGGVAFAGTSGAFKGIIGSAVWFTVLMMGWLLFAIPFAIVFIPAAAIAALGFMWLSKSIFDQ